MFCINNLHQYPLAILQCSIRMSSSDFQNWVSSCENYPSTNEAIRIISIAAH